MGVIGVEDMKTHLTYPLNHYPIHSLQSLHVLRFHRPGFTATGRSRRHTKVRMNVPYKQLYAISTTELRGNILNAFSSLLCQTHHEGQDPEAIGFQETGAQYEAHSFYEC